MKINDGQKEIRTVYLGAFSGLIVTRIIFFTYATLGTWMSIGLVIWALIRGGTFIFQLHKYS